MKRSSLVNVFTGNSAKASSSPETKKAKSKAKYPPPFSLRLSTEERAYLEELAGNQPLSTYIRSVLLGERARKRKTLRKPQIDEQKIAEVLAALGNAHLSSNLNQLAKHANMGTLDVSKNTEQQLDYAYQAVITMRDTLLLALGMKAGSGGQS